MITAQVWDERRCWVGEGPTASGTGNVDEYQVSEHVSFAIPRISGGEILGTNSGPILRDTNGTIHQLPNRFSADGKLETIPTRWNDAKVSPLGDLWLGTLTYDNLPNQAALYRLAADGSVLDRILDGVTCSNGMDWSDDGRTMYYVDTMTHSVEITSAHNGNELGTDEAGMTFIRTPEYVAELQHSILRNQLR